MSKETKPIDEADACELTGSMMEDWPAPGGAGPATVEARPEVDGETTSRLAFTEAAIELIDRLWAMHGPLMFHQSGGCCDGSAPMCYADGEFKTGGQDVLLGTLELSALVSPGEPAPDSEPRSEAAEPRRIGFWMSKEQFAVWSHTHLTVDAVPGRGSGFSLEAPEGKRFLIRSRLL